MDIPATLPGIMFSSQSAPQTYPSGLNWFHAHLHMTSHDDVMGGQSGMLYVGDLRADLLATPGLSAETAATLRRSDTVYLGLRDIQLNVPATATPDKALPATPARWLSGNNYNTALCPAPGSLAGFGYCGVPGALPGTNAIWMFTVNGQYSPTITLHPGRNHIWRIANLSASATYVLQLVDDATKQKLPLTVLSLDGLVAGTSNIASTDLQVGVSLKNLLLLPASRAEVLVANVAGFKTRPMTLHTAGITTGPNGDPWPAMDLAHVVMQPFASAETTATRANPAMVATEVSQVPFAMTLRNGARNRTRPAAPLASAGQDPANCITLPLGAMVRRRITYSENSPTDFELASEVVTPAGAPIDSAHTIGAQQFPMAAALSPDSVPHVCPRLGTQEVWELVNTTQELHNFHIHQTKFRLSVQSDPGVPPNLVAFQDPSGLLTSSAPELQGAVPNADIDLFHDTLPVPPASLDGTTFGRTFVTIPFYAPQQVGNYVFHCHFLDHEDNGMMEPVQVFDPSHIAANNVPTNFAALIEGAICRVR
jgi:FtsP/CotA-like multicopper oxidase with cupredoxin domain